MPDYKFIDLEKLGEFAENCGKIVRIEGKVSGKSEAQSVKKALGTILGWHPTKIADSDDRRAAAEWIMDNRYLIEREAIDAAAHFKRVKKLTAYKGRSVVYTAANALLSASDGSVDSGRLEVFLDAFCQVVMFPAEDLAAFIPAVKAAAVQHIAAICRRLNGGQVEDAPKHLTALIGTLRNISQPHFWQAVERADRAERILAADPYKIYPQMDDDTRHAYRRQVSRLAARRGISEQAAAQYVIDESKRRDVHVGEILFPAEKAAMSGRRKGSAYICTVILLTFAAALTIGYLLSNPWAALLLLLPVSEVVKNLVDLAVLRLVTPQRLPRLDGGGGIPRKGRTLCAVSVLLSDAKSGPRCAKLLEEYAIANRDAGENLYFALLADLAESDTETAEGDDEILKAASDAIDELNRRRGGGFLLLCRPRTWSKGSRKWMGRERKRGAIEDLVSLLRGGQTQLRLSGDANAVKNIKYILALDSDTRLVPGAASRLVAAAMHPLNRAVIDRSRGIVTGGYGVFQPRISVGLGAANRTFFTRLFAGKGGCDPYSGVCSDLYQDLTGNGSFNGKGLIDVDAYHICLTGRFPTERVLSHDLLEGAFLSCAYVSDVELTDGFPATLMSWYARQQRWVRGDWQAAHWLRMKVLDASGKKVANILSDADKWKILDNLRRSLVPIFSLFAILVGVISGVGDFLITAAVAASCYLSGAFLSFAGQMTHKAASRVRLRPESGRLVWESLLLMLAKLAFLPYEAWICAWGTVIAIYRIKVSKRDLLQWVTAEQAERGKKHDCSTYYLAMWPCIAAGVAALVFADSLAVGLISVLWLLAPLSGVLLAAKFAGRTRLEKQDRDYVVQACRRAYSYFTDTGAEDNYLPPDNRQEMPALGTAHRTSPTNIGMALLSHLAAWDMGITDKESAVGQIENTLTTLERMSLWRGHFYNWYDTRNLKVIGGAFVSTVDSGNLVACLLTLAVGLCELGRVDLGKRAQKLALGADFSLLYDKRRGLFYTGWDTQADKASSSRYDLLASEARLTSYTAVALGWVPLRHWRSLGRLHLAGKRSSGLASWTGTMFEYFMPELLLRSDRGSMLWESLRFCLNEQMLAHEPWGESESSFFRFDNSLSYCYKAHGVQSLALNRGMDKDKVISPYSSFLVLEQAGNRAVKNLRRLEKDGLYGKYGFYEAADYTPDRQDGGNFKPVCTYMAHHIGMSIISVGNAVTGGKMAARFMRRPEMAAFKPLLEEKAPDNAPILSERPREEPVRARYAAAPVWSVQSSQPDALSPKSVLLSNGAYSLMMTDTGTSRSRLADIELTRFNPAVDDGFGIAAALRMGDTVLPITQAPWYDRDTQYSFAADLKHFTIEANKGCLSAKMSASVPELETGERRSFSILSECDGDARLVIILRPVLMSARDYEPHPAFARLMMDYESTDKGILIRRRPGGGKPPCWMCVKWSRDAAFSVSWEDTMGRSYMPGVPLAPSAEKGPMPDGALIISIPVRLQKGEDAHTVLSMSVADTRDDALMAAERILDNKAGSSGKTAVAAAVRFGLDESGIDAAMELLTQLEFRTPESSRKKDLILRKSGRAENLWPFGISGDLPIAAYAADSDPALSFRQPVAIHRFLSTLGENYDLALLTQDAGDYMRPENASVRALLQDMDAAHTVGMRGGVHVVDVQNEDALSVLSASVSDGGKPVPGRMLPSKPLEPNPEREYPRFTCNRQGEYECHFDGTLPPRAYSHVIANEHFGYIATESGTGHLWHRNAREGKITPWLNDRFTPTGPERLYLIDGDRRVSLFAADDGYPCRLRYGFGWAEWEKDTGGIKTTLTVFIANDRPARIMTVKAEGGVKLQLEYAAALASGSDNDGKLYTCASLNDKVFTFTAPVGGSSGIAISAGVEPEAFTCDLSSYLQGSFDGAFGPGCVPCCAMRIPFTGAAVITVGACGHDEILSLCDPAQANRELEAVKEQWRTRVCGTLTVDTPDAQLNNYLNGWALYQATACRMKARAGLDQCGGAYGFRDQLQDCRALMWTQPQEARAHIIRAAARQYLEGDVQHWWHPGEDGGKGVRTRYSDDLLWLPFVLAEYVEKTGDCEILTESVPWLTSMPLSPDEKERYEQAIETPENSPLIDHALKALELVRDRGVGANGLLLMGSGDWNDGMNLTDGDMQAESIWLSEFASLTAAKLAKLCRELGRGQIADWLAEWSAQLNSAIAASWKDGCYPRAFRPDGTVLGRRDSVECVVDSISQSFAAFAGVDKEKTDAALMTAYSALCGDGIVRLFTPPFDGEVDDPGYIVRYCPGFRENGGQYTHAAIWLASALIRSGKVDEGVQALLDLLPAKKPPHIYRGEPYVIAGDVCASPNMTGRAGWTWYTGSAAWYYTTALEDLLGIRLRQGRVYVQPNLPSNWQGYSAALCGHRIDVVRKGSGYHITCDGAPIESKGIELPHPADK